MYSFDKVKHKLYINIFILFSTVLQIVTVLQMVTKFAGVQKCFDPLDKEKKENMTLDDSLLILANILVYFLRK